jgi:hypothetical protein
VLFYSFLGIKIARLIVLIWGPVLSWPEKCAIVRWRKAGRSPCHLGLGVHNARSCSFQARIDASGSKVPSSSFGCWRFFPKARTEG